MNANRRQWKSVEGGSAESREGRTRPSTRCMAAPRWSRLAALLPADSSPGPAQASLRDVEFRHDRRPDPGLPEEMGNRRK